MRIDVSPYPATVGRAMHRVSAALAKYAPPEITIVGPNQEADIQVIQYWTSDIVKPIYRTAPRHVVIYHCTNRLFPDAHPLLRGMPVEFADDALLVVSWHPLPDGDKYLMLPLGAEPSIWFKEDVPLIYKTCTTGYVRNSESIGEVYNATRAVGGEMVHIGGACISGNGITLYEGVDDSLLRKLYCQSEYVSGLRRGEGYELVCVESLMAQGGRPLIYGRKDQDWLRPWSITIQEGRPEFVEEQLREVLSKPAVPVSEEERQGVVAQLSWEPICRKFWSELLARL